MPEYQPAEFLMNVEWLETFELGVPEIDGDHRTIVD
jgi:hypothetical protein